MGMFEIADELFEEGLEAKLRQLRSAGLSIDEIVLELEGDGVRVSRETVRRWCHRVGLPMQRVPAS